jgi:hypothetical protein
VRQRGGRRRIYVIEPAKELRIDIPANMAVA